MRPGAARKDVVWSSIAPPYGSMRRTPAKQLTRIVSSVERRGEIALQPRKGVMPGFLSDAAKMKESVRARPW